MKSFLVVATFLVVTGTLVNGAISAEHLVHGSPLLTVVGAILGIGMGVLAACAVDRLLLPRAITWDHLPKGVVFTVKKIVGDRSSPLSGDHCRVLLEPDTGERDVWAEISVYAASSMHPGQQVRFSERSVELF